MKRNILRNRILIGSCFLILIIATVFFFFTDSSDAYTHSQGVEEQPDVKEADLREYSYDMKKDLIRMSLNTDIRGDLLDADAVADIREARNYFRYEASITDGFSDNSSYNEIVKNSYGDILLDSTFYLLSMPVFPECVKLKSGINTRYGGSQEDCNLFRVPLEHKIYYTFDENIGNTVHVELFYDNNDYDTVNCDIASVLEYIDTVNLETPSFQQIEISAFSSGKEIVYLTADLIYRDFLWWQSPDMSESFTDCF